jgi:hypothetical protein
MLLWLHSPKESERKVMLLLASAWRAASREYPQGREELAANLDLCVEGRISREELEARYGSGMVLFPPGNARLWIATTKPAREVACRLIRELFGNPFRPLSFSAAWRTDTAVALARQMDDKRDFSAMPILADALQDAGCDSEDILSHCRGVGPHVRGCWVVDLALGKE